MGLEWEFEDDLPRSPSDAPSQKSKSDAPQPRLRDIHIHTEVVDERERHTAACPSGDLDGCYFVVYECYNYEAVFNTMASHIRKVHTPKSKRDKK